MQRFIFASESTDSAEYIRRNTTPAKLIQIFATLKMGRCRQPHIQNKDAPKEKSIS
jgi:hypothetical protein